MINFVTLEKYIEKRSRKKHNIMFQRDQKGFFQALEAVEKHKGEGPKMQRFAEFWGAKLANTKFAIDGRGKS